MLEITNKTKTKLSKRELFLFQKIADKALGKKYELSLVICGDVLSKKHNVLSYPLSKEAGEIFLNPKRKGKFTLLYLFAHSCAHLKGYDHGPAMDRFEAQIFQGPKNSQSTGTKTKKK